MAEDIPNEEQNDRSEATPQLANVMFNNEKVEDQPIEEEPVRMRSSGD